MTAELFDDTCLEIIEELFRHPKGLGFNELSKPKGPFNKKTLSKHLSRHLVPKFVEVLSDGKGKKSKHILTKQGISRAFKIRLEKYGKLAMSKWAEDWLNEGYEPIDVSNVIMEAPVKDVVYLMRNKSKKEAQLITPPFLDANIYLRLTSGQGINLVPDVLTETAIVHVDAQTLVSKLIDFVREKKPLAGLDPGPAYKRFLGTLRENAPYVGSVEEPIPTAGGKILQKTISGRDEINNLSATILRAVHNPVKSGYVGLMSNYGFWVILNPEHQNLLAAIFKDQNKTIKLKENIFRKLLPFIEQFLMEANQ